jgi:hypothetical protein
MLITLSSAIFSSSFLSFFVFACPFCRVHSPLSRRAAVSSAVLPFDVYSPFLSSPPRSASLFPLPFFVPSLSVIVQVPATFCLYHYFRYKSMRVTKSSWEAMNSNGQYSLVNQALVRVGVGGGAATPQLAMRSGWRVRL